jgi:hypothetical protein
MRLRLAFATLGIPVLAFPTLVTEIEFLSDLLDVGNFDGMFTIVLDDEWVFVAVCVHGVLVAAYLGLWRTCMGHQRMDNHKILRASLRCGFACTIVVPLVCVYYSVTKTITPPTLSLPSPNGYDLLMEASEAVLAWDLVNNDEVTAEQRRQFVDQNSQAFELAASAIDVPSQVPVDYASMETRVWRQGDRQSIFQAMLIRAHSYSDARQVDETLRVLLDVIRLVEQSETGGLVLDRLTSIATQNEVSQQLEQLVSELTPNQCRMALEALTDHDARAEPLEGFLIRDRILCAASGDWRLKLHELVDGLSGRTRKLIQRAENRYRGRIRVLICDLAIQRFMTERPSRITRLDELVPQYLPRLPRDPYATTEIRLAIHPDRYVLYCLGPNGRDDGGIEGRDNGDWPVLERRLGPAAATDPP